MRRFLAFGGDTYYPSGGWNDFRGDFDTQADAATRLRNPDDDFDWWHIVDTATGESVEKWNTLRYRGQIA